MPCTLRIIKKVPIFCLNNKAAVEVLQYKIQSKINRVEAQNLSPKDKAINIMNLAQNKLLVETQNYNLNKSIGLHL